MKRLIQFSFLIYLLTGFTAWSVPNWTQRADFGGGGRHRASSFSIGTKGYLGVGHYNGTGVNIVLKDWWEYDPATNAWTQKADFIGNNGNGNYATLTFSFDDAAYLGGGIGNSELYRYDPTTNTWIQVASPPIKPLDTPGFTIGNYGYFIRFDNLWEYNRVNDQWTDKGPVPFSILSWYSAFSLNNKGYVKTGYELWEYKPLTNQWAQRAPFPGLARSGSGSFIQNGKAYILTGFGMGGLSDVNSEVWEYNPETNSWWQYANFPGSSRRFSCTFNIGEKAFLSTGTNGTNFSDLWEFNLVVGLNDLGYDDSFTSFPNPANEFITFQSEKYTSAVIKIYSNDGNLVKELEMNNHSVTLQRDRLQSGNYYFTVESEGQIIHSNHIIFL